MQPILSREQIREAERFTIQHLNIPATILMEHAALAVVGRLKARFGKLLPKTSGLILAGTGNNGGDALATARILILKGYRTITVVQLENNKLSTEAAHQRKILQKLGISIQSKLDPLAGFDWIVDGLFGTGLTRPISGKCAATLDLINAKRHTWIVSIDIPSGLCADTGGVLGVCVRASETITLGFMKKGLLTNQAANYVGRLSAAPLQIPRQIPALKPSAFLVESADIQLPKRFPSSHKGDYGHVYVWAGVKEKQGASLLATLSALKAGCGLVTLVGWEQDIEAIRPRLPPEVMSLAVEKSFFSKTESGVLVLGPGMGLGESKWAVLSSALLGTFALVLDGDALTLISENTQEATALLSARKEITSLTPHPKEASRLLNTSVEKIQADRYKSVKEIASRFNGLCLLKGKGTLVCDQKGRVVVITQGTPALAKAGSGDILSGIIGSLLAQKMDPFDAITSAAYLHGRASEILSQKRGESYSPLASEIADTLPEVLKEIARTKS